jgi:hypothetical protein
MLKMANRLITVGILVFLVFKLNQIGWMNVWEALPRTPVFYALFVIIYLTLPLSEAFIYRLVWPVGFWEGFLTFLRKRAYNEEVMGYSGEVYLYLWAKKQLALPAGAAFRAVRDNNIVSSVSSSTVAFTLLGALAYTGQIKPLALVDDLTLVYIVTAVVVIAALIAVGLRFRRHIFSMPAKTTATVLGIHLTRLLVANGLLVVQWAVVEPNIALNVWFTYLATLIVLNRIPFLPSKDLFFVGLGIQMSGLLDVVGASVAAIFLASSILTRLSNLTILILTQRFSEDLESQEAATT